MSLLRGCLTTAVLGVTSLILSGAAAADTVGPGSAQSSQVVVQQVEVHLTDHGPVVLLKAEQRAIPIFVDLTVASSIHAVLTGQHLKRPLSHDLMRTILESFGGKVTQTVITMKDGIFYGALTVAMPTMSKVFDSRSSDAIALAIHFKAPILVGRDLLESAGKATGEGKELTL